MSESKIACPHCGQHITLDDAWAGKSLNCPACQQLFIVPGTPAPAPAPANAGVRLSHSSAPPPPPPPPGPRPQAARPGAMRQPAGATRTSGLAITSLILSLTGCLSLGGVICGHLARRQIRRDPSVTGNGLALTGLILGYLGLIATAAFVAAGAYGLKKGQEFAAEFEKELKAAQERGDFGTNFVMGDFSTNGTEEIELPDDPVGGTIVGVPFDYYRARINLTAGTLAIEEGEDFIADQSVLIFLFLKPGEGVTNRTWKVTSATPGAGRPHVHLRWLKDDDSAGTTALSSGYTMELTTGSETNGFIPGKITLKAGGKFPVNLTGEFNAKVD
jgi:hypothetical protein